VALLFYYLSSMKTASFSVLYYIVICGLSCSTTFFSHYLTNDTIFGGKKLLNIKCIFPFSLQLLSATPVILRIFQWYIINLHTSSCIVPIPVRF